jgi:uncharacterized protein (DUF362 family)
MTWGTQARSLDAAAVGDAVATVAEPLLDALADADRVAIVPDVDYPYHPSTGMTTNPAVLGGLLSILASRRPDAEFVLAVRSGPEIDTRRTVGYLGFDDVADTHGADIAVLDDASPSDGETSAGGEEDGVPAPFSDAAVVPVPSARIDGCVPLFGCLALLARAAGADPADASSVARAVEAVDPAGAVVDATYTFTGEPARARALLAGDDVATVEHALARLLGVDTGDIPGFAAAARVTDTADRSAHRSAASSVDGLDVDGLAAALPDGELPASTEPHRLVRAGYRLYTRVSGDVYPPQLEADG